ncbi:MAG: hypothetical protein ABIK37_04900, partial [candidate division WOR-3 bacterium]
AMLDEDCDAVGSRAITLPGGYSRMARAIALALSCRFGVGNSEMRVGSSSSRRIPADTASCPAYRRRVFEHIGRFNPQLIRNQDIEFNLRLRRAGMKLVLDQGITSAYQARSTLGELAVNCFSNGYWVIRSLRVCGHAFSARHLVPLFFVMGMIVIMTSVATLTTSHEARWLIPTAAAGAYAVAGAISLLSTHGKKAIPEALLVFPVMHCSYGLGSLWALLTIWRPVPVRPSVSTSS